MPLGNASVYLVFQLFGKKAQTQNPECFVLPDIMEAMLVGREKFWT
jgi:hypothetical protein